MKYFYLFLIMLGLCACAGNPPDWWNPSGTYGNAEPAKAISSQNVSKKQRVSRPAVQEIPVEESIETSVEEYEEISLNPMEQMEQSVSEESSEQADPMYASEAEHLPADGSLPPPTVLE